MTRNVLPAPQALPVLLASGTDPAADPPRFLSEAACAALVAEIRTLPRGRARPQIEIVSEWRGDVRWARNRPHVASDWRTTTLALTVSVPGGQVSVQTDQVDPASLAAAVRWCEDALRFEVRQGTPWPPQLASAPQHYPQTQIWSDATYAQAPEQRSAIAGTLIRGAAQAGMLAAGYLAVEARGTSLYTNEGRFLYAPQTLAQCSMTVRDPEGTGSGWAGASSYDWTRFDPQHLAAIALDKCLTSRNPVKIEPGRYTLILEPQATFGLASFLMRRWSYLDRAINEENTPGPWPFKSTRTATVPVGWKGQTQRIRFTRIGERVMDDRLTIAFDPLDPDLGTLPFTVQGEPVVPVTWVDHGVLTTLSYDRAYARQMFHQEEGRPNTGAFRMSGGNTTIEEMIATTERGLLVTRFSGVDLLDQPSMLLTGLTRDGLWLIEHGKISKAVKNLRWTESPMAVFNQVEQLGVPVPVFSPGLPAIVPSMKVRDFNFTSVVDAV